MCPIACSDRTCCTEAGVDEYSVTSAGGRPVGWRQPEGASNTAPPLPMKLQTQAGSPPIFRTAAHWISEVRLLLVNRETLISICWLDAKSWAQSLERATKLSVDSTQLKSSRLEKHIPVPGGWLHSWMISLCFCQKKDAGMRSIRIGKVSGHCCERPINALINASSLIRGCQPPLAPLFNTCYCFHGNWHSHPRPHINIQLHLI